MMHISYEKITEEDYLQLTLFHNNNEERHAEVDLLVDASKINSTLSRIKKIKLPDEIKKININFIQLKSELFYENLFYLHNLIIFFSKRRQVPDINIRIYSHKYFYFQREIYSFIYCTSNEANGYNDCIISFRKVLMINVLKKVLGLRVFLIASKAFYFLIRPFK
ncbi:MAG: hypothetical protein ACTXOO_05290 [Sodalis sp. (in: enterobacteria)]